MFYMVTDCYGTRVFTWTLRDAIEWLVACSPNAKIENTITGTVLIERKFVRAY